MNQDQYLQYIQSHDFVNRYLTALSGEREERINNKIANTDTAKYPLSNEGISKFARDRGYDQLFIKQQPNVIKASKNNGNNEYLANSLEYENPIKAMLFSQKNIDFLQQKCIKEIYYKTNKKYVISPQDHAQVLQLITNVYNNITIPDYYAKVDSQLFKQEISYLNSFILKELVEYVYSSLLNYISYSNFLANGIQPIDRPVNMSIKGTNTLII